MRGHVFPEHEGIDRNRGSSDLLEQLRESAAKLGGCGEGAVGLVVATVKIAHGGLPPFSPALAARQRGQFLKKPAPASGSIEVASSRQG